MKSWLMLLVAIGTEVLGTVLLKFSDGFSRIIPTVTSLALYGLSFWALSVVLRKIEVSIVYAIWSGLGTAVVFMVGVIFFGDKLSLLKVASVLFIIIGVVGLNFARMQH